MAAIAVIFIFSGNSPDTWTAEPDGKDTAAQNILLAALVISNVDQIFSLLHVLRPDNQT